jgi:hypothetical protein
MLYVLEKSDDKAEEMIKQKRQKTNKQTKEGLVEWLKW